jgi:hypothetical protein
MIVESVIQLVGPMLLELAIREVAVPAAKKIMRGNTEQSAAAQEAIDEFADATSMPLLSSVRSVQVVSTIPGRVRVQVAGLSGQPELARKLNDEIGALPGVQDAQASARTGRMLVTYEPELQTTETLTAAVDRTRATHLSRATIHTRHLAAVV